MVRMTYQFHTKIPSNGDCLGYEACFSTSDSKGMFRFQDGKAIGRTRKPEELAVLGGTLVVFLSQLFTNGVD